MNTKKRFGFLSGLFKIMYNKKKNVLFEIDDD